MTKVLLIDADGVALGKQLYFSEVYSKEYGVSPEKITPFFKNEFRNCQLGKADIKEVLPSYLNQWGWQKSVNDFLQYWFEKSTIADEKVVSIIQKIRSKGIKCYLVANQEKYRAEYIRKNLYFEKKFDDCFFSCEIGHLKAEVDFFKFILGKLRLSPEEVEFFDDEEENIKAAKQLGIQTKFFIGVSDLELLLK